MLAPSPNVAALQRARNLIADPARWTVGASARNFAGEPCDVDDGAAVTFCAIGALGRDEFILDHTLNEAAMELFLNAGDFDLVPAAWVNDNLGHAAVMKMYDRAFALAVVAGVE